MGAIVLAMLLTGCGAVQRGTNLPATPSITSAATAIPTLNPATIQLTLSGDTTLDTTMAPDSTCGPTAAGGWEAFGRPVYQSSAVLSVQITRDTGDAQYAIDGTSALAFVVRPQVQTVITTSGTITIDHGGKHAHIDATAGFSVPPNNTTQTGHVVLTADIRCP